jgi:hypothetical protein
MAGTGAGHDGFVLCVSITTRATPARGRVMPRLDPASRTAELPEQAGGVQLAQHRGAVERESRRKWRN